MLIQKRFEGKIIRVIDGDTLLVEMKCPHCDITQERRVRLARIDAPELNGPCISGAMHVKQYLAQMVEGQACHVQLAQRWPDKYGRIIGEVLVGGVNISTALLASGLVTLYGRARAARS